MSVALRVLIVEDSEDDTALLLRELQRGGYDVSYERVDSPTAMNSALSRQEWDIVISDHSMPHFSGTNALSLLRTKGPEVPSFSSQEPWAGSRSGCAERRRAGLRHEGQFEAASSRCSA